MSFSTKKRLFFITLFTGLAVPFVSIIYIIVAPNSISPSDSPIFGIAFGLVMLSWILEMIFFRCPSCRKRMKPSSWANFIPIVYIWELAKMKHCPHCDEDLYKEEDYYEDLYREDFDKDDF